MVVAVETALTLLTVMPGGVVLTVLSDDNQTTGGGQHQRTLGMITRNKRSTIKTTKT